MPTQTHRTVSKRTGEVRETRIHTSSDLMERDGSGLDEHAARLVKDREAREDRAHLAAWLASPEAQTRPGFGQAGKAVLPDGPRVRPARESLRTSGIGGRKAAQSRQGVTGGAVDLSTVSRRAKVDRPAHSSEPERMRTLMLRVAQSVTTAYPDECSGLRADIKELASYFRHDTTRLVQLHKLDERCKEIQRSVH